MTIKLVLLIISVEPKLCHHASETYSQSFSRFFTIFENLPRILPPFPKRDEKDNQVQLVQLKIPYSCRYRRQGRSHSVNVRQICAPSHRGCDSTYLGPATQGRRLESSKVRHRLGVKGFRTVVGPGPRGERYVQQSPVSPFRKTLCPAGCVRSSASVRSPGWLQGVSRGEASSHIRTSLFSTSGVPNSQPVGQAAALERAEVVLLRGDQASDKVVR